MISFAGLEIPDLGDHSPDPFQQFLELLAFQGFDPAERFLAAAFAAAFNKRLPV